MQAVLAAIQKSNKSSTSRSSALPSYSVATKKGTSTFSPNGGAVNPKTSKGSTSDSPLGILSNLASDIKETVVGIPGGIVQTAEHPIATAQAIGHDYRKRYGPLFGYLNGGGDIGKFGHMIAQHPLAPLLDASSVLTGGGALAAKIGQSAHIAEAGKLSNVAKSLGAGESAARAIQHPALTKLYNATKGGNRMMKVSKNADASGIKVPLPNNPVQRMRRNTALNVQEKLPAGFGGPFSLRARAGKAAALEQMTHAANARALVHGAVNDAASHMEKVAKQSGSPSLATMHAVADNIVRGTVPSDYAKLVKSHRSTMTPAEGVSQAAHDAETAKIVGQHSSKPVNDLFHAVQRAMTQRTLAAGGHVNKNLFRSSRGLSLAGHPAVAAVMKYRDAHSTAALDAASHWIKAGKFTKSELDQQRVLQHNLVREAQGKNTLTPAATDALFAKVGLPPVSYNPDTLTLGSAGSKASLAANRGVLFKQGTRVFSPKNIVAAHDLASHATDALHAHDMLLSAASHIPVGKSIPTGWVWVKDRVPKTLQDKHAISAIQRDSAPHTKEAFYAALKAEQAPTGRMALPAHAYHDISQGQAGMAAARIEAVSKAASVWKHLTLGFRPGFLTTNIGSNQWMFHMKNGWNIPSMMRAKKALSSGVAKQFHAAETSGGSTWGGFEKMQGAEKAGSKVAKAKGAGNTLYNIVGAHEHWLRTISMYETARRLPQVKRELRALKGGKYNPADHGGRTMFHEAYARAIRKNPHIRDLVSKNIDDAAGNYRYFTHAEQMLKNIVPFYSWDRHSVRGLVRLIEDHPAKMALLNQIGMQGDARFKKMFGDPSKLPEFMRSYVMDGYIKSAAKALGLGNVTSWDSKSQNPYQTAADVVQAISGSQGEKQRALSSLLGPLATGPIEQFSGKSLLTGSPLPKAHTSDPFLQTIERTGAAIPPLKLLQDLVQNRGASKKMLPATRGQTLAGYAGVYLRNPDLAVAQKVAKTVAAADAKLNTGPRVPSNKKKKVVAIPNK
jgi:hypothetical protein